MGDNKMANVLDSSAACSRKLAALYDVDSCFFKLPCPLHAHTHYTHIYTCRTCMHT